MNDEKIEIKKDDVITVYNTARNTNDYGTLHALESLFGKEMFKPKDVTERIKTFYDAYCELGNGHPFVKSYEKYVNTVSGEEPDVIAYLKLRIICAALNEGWKPKFTEDEYRYYPYFMLCNLKEIGESEFAEIMDIKCYDTKFAGLVYTFSSPVPSNIRAHLGSHLCLKDERLAVYCGKQFIDIWADYLLVRK